jgi:phosphopantetheinyl transferase
MQMTARRRLESETALIMVLEHDKALGDEYLHGLLDWSTDELERIASFKHQGSKTSWCLSRLLLDDALCEFAAIESARRRLEYGEYGKPFIRGCDTRFNWSHAEGCVALALAVGIEIGIDIEEVGRSSGNYLDVAKDCFRAEESEWIGQGEGESAWTRFLSLFVQKEAWLKATGQGLNLPLAGARADLALPPAQSPGRLLFEVGRMRRYFLAVDASIGEGYEKLSFTVERRELGSISGSELFN